MASSRRRLAARCGPAEALALAAAVVPPSPLRLLIESPAEMLQSHIIDIDGVHVGAAIRLDCGYRFVAINLQVAELDSTIWPTLADVERVARCAYLAGRTLAPAAWAPTSATAGRTH